MVPRSVLQWATIDIWSLQGRCRGAPEFQSKLHAMASVHIQQPNCCPFPVGAADDRAGPQPEVKTPIIATGME